MKTLLLAALLAVGQGACKSEKAPQVGNVESERTTVEAAASTTSPAGQRRTTPITIAMRRREEGCAMDHAVADRINLPEGLDDADSGVAQDLHDGLDRGHMVWNRHLLHDLLGARLGIHEAGACDADAFHKTLAEHLLALHVKEHVLERRRTGVYY